MNRFYLLFFNLLTVILLLGFSPSTTLAMADKPPIVLPQGVLNAVQIKQLFSDKTFTATIDDKAHQMVFFFGKDGALIKVQDGWQKEGSWATREDGRLCVELKGASRDCRIIIKQGDQHRQYAVKKDGNHRYEITYSDFRQGNQLAKTAKTPLLPKGTLPRKEVIKLFSENTVESVTASKGRVSKTYYKADGSLEQLRNGVRRDGKWRVNNDSRICIQMGTLKEKCRIIVKEDGEIKKYIVKKNGRHQHSVSYRNFTPGKAFK